jgi:hypothetical protein
VAELYVKKIKAISTLFLTLFSLVLSGCYLTSTQEVTADPEDALTPTISTLLTQDASDVMAGICFAAAADAAGQVFVIRNAEEHIRFYELADNSRLCDRPVERRPFDFEGERILAGLWSAGTGCTASHEVLSMTRDDDAKEVRLRLRFVTEGDCDYALLRPFWLALDRVADYDVEIQVES